MAKPDKYQHPYNTGGAHLGFVGRLNPKTGETEVGTILLARGDGDRGQGMQPSALEVDSRGMVYVGGEAGDSPPVTPGAIGSHFKGGGAFFWALDGRFNRAFSGKICAGTVRGIALGRGTIITAGEGTGNLETRKAFKDDPTGQDGWIAILSTGRR
jgi:hypothetical protein